MKNKAKGSNAERELLLMLFKEGYGVSRVAGSGSSQLPTPDIIACKSSKCVAIECKTKSGNYLNIRPEQVEELKIWEGMAGFPAFVAWRLGKDKWYFISYKELNKTKKAHSIKKAEIMEKGLDFHGFLNLMTH